MMAYEYSPKVRVLLMDQSKEKVHVLYNNNPSPFAMPLVGKRPPYFVNPRYEPYYPTI